VVRYYLRVADALLPHVRGRACTLARFPEGVHRYGWYQTQCRGPAWLRRVRIGTQDYCVLDDLASLGLHVFVPVAPGHTFAQTKAFARALAGELAARDSSVLDRSTRALRSGRVLVDWGQNDATKSLPAPYSLRAFPHPAVSVPLTWGEIDAARRPEDLVFGPAETIERLERNGDLFAPVLERRQTLTNP